ncbi:hypothetical protein T459_22839 [Capsicum annuum]|uniref:Uncharacterized protein n=1 Tax=Capsicum annuum TaxID=4072 RepID=A0A2G2YQR8_CAPAN|nr:hypothetical protein T459_22839 [Capsicum annuum]
MTQKKKKSVLSIVDIFNEDGKEVSTGFVMAPKEKNPKPTKKEKKRSVPQKLFNEKSNYEEEEPLLKKQRKKISPKNPLPPPLVEVKESEESDTKPTTSEHTAFEQTNSEKQGSEHAESEENDSDHLDFEELMAGQPESKGPSTESPFAEPQVDEESSIRGTMVKWKNPEVRDDTRWQIPKSQKIFFDGLFRTNRRAFKSPIFGENRIITKGLSRYPEVERKFHDYDLGWTTREGNSFFPTLVKEFYANYQVRLENMCKEREKSIDQPFLDKVLVQGLMVDVSEATINRPFAAAVDKRVKAALDPYKIRPRQGESSGWKAIAALIMVSVDLVVKKSKGEIPFLDLTEEPVKKKKKKDKNKGKGKRGRPDSNKERKVEKRERKKIEKKEIKKAYRNNYDLDSLVHCLRNPPDYLHSSPFLLHLHQLNLEIPQISPSQSCLIENAWLADPSAFYISHVLFTLLISFALFHSHDHRNSGAGYHRVSSMPCPTLFGHSL